MLLSDLLSELGVPGVELRLGSLGSFEARQAYLEELKGHLHAHEDQLSKDVRERIDINPLRAFDSDDEGTRAVMEGAPTIVGRLEGEDAEHFERGAGAARRGRHRLRRSTRPWSAASTTTRGRSSPSSATRSERSRRSAAAAATTA